MKRQICGLVMALALISCTHPRDKDSSVEKLFTLVDVERQMTEAFEAMLMGPIVDQMASELQLNAAEREELKEVYRDWYKYDLNHKEMMDKLKKLYAETFTLKELNQLNKFYGTPVGQKFLDKAPELMKLAGEIGMKETILKQEKLMERIKAFAARHQE